MRDFLEPFEGPKTSIEGAKERLVELDSRCKPFTEIRDYKIVTHTDPKTSEKVVKVRLNQRLPPRIGDEASDIIKKLRLVLDRTFIEAARLLGHQRPADIYFPFGRSVEELNRQIENRCKGVHPELIEHVVNFKPHYGEGSNGVLWSMNSLAAATHRDIVALRFQDTAWMRDALVSVVGPLQIASNSWSRLNNELEIARLGQNSKLELKHDFALAMQIVFAGQAHALSGRELMPTLHLLTNMVEGIVLSIEAETIRLRGART